MVSRREVVAVMIQLKAWRSYPRSISIILSLCMLFCACKPSSGLSDFQSELPVRLVEVQAIDQDGRSLKFTSEVIGDHIVVVNFIYTSCRTLCPISSAIFARLQELLHQKLPMNNARLISISLDPVYDSPSRLKAYAEQYAAGSQWYWITGSVENIDAITRGLGTSRDNFREHDSFILVGDARTGKWSAFNTLPEPEKLLAEVERLFSIREREAVRR